MERLTASKNSSSYVELQIECNDMDEDCEDCGVCNDLSKITDRLSAYEDSGATPEQAAEWAKAHEEGRLHIAEAEGGAVVLRAGAGLEPGTG